MSQTLKQMGMKLHKAITIDNIVVVIGEGEKGLSQPYFARLDSIPLEPIEYDPPKKGESPPIYSSDCCYMAPARPKPVEICKTITDKED